MLTVSLHDIGKGTLGRENIMVYILELPVRSLDMILVKDLTRIRIALEGIDGIGLLRGHAHDTGLAHGVGPLDEQLPHADIGLIVGGRVLGRPRPPNQRSVHGDVGEDALRPAPAHGLEDARRRAQSFQRDLALLGRRAQGGQP